MENTPNLIGGNRIVEKLGAGGMGAVYLAKHQTLGREVALKLLPPEFTQHKEYVERFLREARAAAQLKHPNVVQVYDAGEQGGQFYISMEFVKGKSLGHLQREKGPLDEAVALRFLQQAAHGLAAAHALGLVHRDIKPENLLIDTDGTVKVADFGLVSDVEGDSGLTQPGAMLGTPTYMSPEQCDGLKADVRSDIYSLGAAFFRLMTGSAPFTAPTPIGVLYKHRYEATPDPRTIRPQISEATAQMLLRMMAKRPEDRFQTAADVAAFADAVLKGGEATLRPGAMSAGTPMLSPVGMPAVTPMPSSMPTPMPMPGSAPALTPMPATLLPHTLVGSPTPTPLTPYGQMPYATPMPGAVAAPPKPRSKAALALVAILVLALAGAGGWFGWQKFNEMQVAEAKTQAGQARALKQYDGALAVLDAAIARYPEEASLKTLRDQIDVESVVAQVEAFKKNAFDAQTAGNDVAAVAAYDKALALEAQRKALPGLTPDPLLPGLKKKAEDLRDFHDFMAQGRKADETADFAKAAECYGKAATFEAPPGTEARNSAKRATFDDLMAQAKGLEKEGKLTAALEKVNAAAELNLRSLKEDQDRISQHIRFDGLLADADKLKTEGNLREAAAKLKTAANLAQGSKADELDTESQNLVRDADYNDAMAAGDAAFTKQEWTAAKNAFTKAGEIKKGQPEPSKRYNQAVAGETAAEGAGLFAQKKWADAKAKYLRAAELHPEEKTYAGKAAEIEAAVKRIGSMEEAARAADGAQDWKKSATLWTALESEDPENKTIYRQRANSACYNDLDQQADSLVQEGKLDDALALANRAKGFDTVGNGERSATKIQQIERKIAARQAAQAAGETLAAARSLVEQGNAAAAVANLRAAAQQNPQNGQIAAHLAGAEGVEAVERGYRRLEEIRQDAEASAKTSADADDDKKIAARFQAIKDWQGKLDGSRGAARQAWLEGKFELIAQAADTMKGQAREMGNEFTNIANFFSGKAADAAQAKANVGGAVGGLLGGRGRGFGGVGASTEVGRNNKKAAIFQGTANALTAAGNEARRIGASE